MREPPANHRGLPESAQALLQITPPRVDDCRGSQSRVVRDGVATGPEGTSGACGRRRSALDHLQSP